MRTARGRLAAAAALAAALIPGAGAAAEAIAFPQGRAVITTERARIVLDVEIARTPSQWSHGLMNRRSLPRNEGMMFVFPGDVRGPFWMKNVTIPLSIAFYDRRGRIRRIMQMEPCRDDPCRLYDPGVAYRGALEVNQGAFGRWGVRRGDTIRLIRR